MDGNTLVIWITGTLQYLLINIKVVALGNVSLVINKVLRLFVNTLTVEDKHYLLNRDNLRQPIQMQVSKKEKTSAEFFFAF